MIGYMLKTAMPISVQSVGKIPKPCMYTAMGCGKSFI